MKIKRNIQIPTGNILVVEGEKADLELLSLYDYGKDVNVKADFLGLERKLDKVEHTAKLLPLEDKWVITVSTQYKCLMGCKFCDCPKIKFSGRDINATHNDLINQIKCGLALHPEVKSSKHLNVHFARIGEPTWNPEVWSAAMWIKATLKNAHPVVSTMMPKDNPNLKSFIEDWMYIKNTVFNGNAGLQLSINSTDEKERTHMFSGSCLSLGAIAGVMDGKTPIGRKITLNFAVAGYTIDPSVLLHYFNPKHYIVKLTPMHKTQLALANNIVTDGDYTTYAPYEHYEEALKKAGYDVLVFIASKEEDLGRITCGNAILSGSNPLIPYIDIQCEQ